MKNKILLVALMLSTFFSYSQTTDNLKFVQTVCNQSTLIFEGTAISKGNSFRAKNNAIYTPYDVQITKVISGDASLKTIQILMEGGQIEENGMGVSSSSSHGLNLLIGLNSIIFCSKLEVEGQANSYNLNEQVCFSNKNETTRTNFLSQQYNDINDLLKDLSTVLKINVPQKKSADVSESINYSFDLTSYATKTLNYKNHIDFFTSKHNANSKLKIATALTNDITISTGNEITTSAGSVRFLEFDVFVKSNVSGLYFDNCLLRLQYNASAFGSNMMASGTATITKGASFNSATYIDPQTNFIDQNSNTLGIPFGIDYTQTTFNRTQLTTTNKILLHVKLKIQNCGQTTDLQFVDASSISFLNFYTTTPNAPNTAGNSFDNSTYISPSAHTLCSVIVDDFNTPINGGKDEIFTIKGFNFGATRGNGQVKFRDANDGVFPFIQKLDPIDYVSWSDTLIKIKLPSMNQISGLNQTPGSGPFVIKNNFGDSIVSFFNSNLEQLVVHYSVMQEYNTTDMLKHRYYLKNANSLGGYTVRLDTSISNYPDRKGCVIKAIKDWRCVAAVNLVLGNDTNLYTATNDKINTIFFTPTLPVNVVANTITQNEFCTSGGITYAITDFDTKISRAYNFFYDTTGATLPAGLYDFYEIMVHEIGHGIGLKHVIDETQIMHYTSKYSSTSNILGANRKRLVPYSGDADGELNIVTSSPSAIFGQCTSFTSHQISNSSCSQVGLYENLKSKYEFSVYPNPTNGDVVTLSFLNSENSKVKINVCDVTGRILFDTSIPNNVSESNKYTINLNGFSNGLYLVNLTIDGVNFSQKVIKN